MFFKKKTETKGAVANGAAKAAPTAGPQTAVEIPPAAPAAKVEPVAAAAPAPVAATKPAEQTAPNVLQNGDFSSWSSGAEFAAVAPYQALADGWRLAFDSKDGQLAAGKTANGIRIEVVKPLNSWLGLEQPSKALEAFVGRSVVVRLLASASTPASLTVVLIVATTAGQLRSVGWVVPVGAQPEWQSKTISIPALAPDATLVSASLFVELPNALPYSIDVQRIEILPA